MIDRTPTFSARTLLIPLVACVFGVAASFASCAGGSNPEDDEPTARAKGGAGGTKLNADGVLVDGKYGDFPATPLTDDGTAPGVAQAFGDPPAADTAATSDPCLVEPALDAMIPNNWTPLEFSWASATGLNAFELRLVVANQANPLVIYTSKPSFKLPAALWTLLTAHSSGQDIDVTLRAGTWDGSKLTKPAVVGSKGKLHLAPTGAAGPIVYFSARNVTTNGVVTGEAKLSSAVVGSLDPSITVVNQNNGCPGCHALSPDGKQIFYSIDERGKFIRVGNTDAAGSTNVTISQAALTQLDRSFQTFPALSQAHYSANDAVILTTMRDNNQQTGRANLVWTDLISGATGVILRKNDPRQVDFPAWSHDGNTIAYTSVEATDLTGDGNVAFPGITAANKIMDIYTVPYTGRAGGDAAPLKGADDPDSIEYYPSFSPNDTFVAFNRAAKGATGSYDEPTGQVYIVPAAGGTATEVKGNAPAQCAIDQNIIKPQVSTHGVTATGWTNAWPRWAQKAETSNGHKYYWLAFSSKRNKDNRPQLYIASVVTKVDGTTETLENTYPALYVPSQDPTWGNHTPAWDVTEAIPFAPR